MFCHSATGSLLLSAIGVLQHDHDVVASRAGGLFRTTGCRLNDPLHTTPSRKAGQPRGQRFNARHNARRLLHREKACHKMAPQNACLPRTAKGNATVNAPFHQPPQIARANGLDLCYEIFGDPAAEPLILIMGLGSQMIQWDDDFCRQLAARGFRVIRFDNRDIGQSSKLSGGTPLTALELLKLRLFKIPVKAPYRLSDMAEDTVGLMDALGIKSAHLVGASMGGMIAQEIAISFPQRVRSLTSIMSTTGNPKVPPPTKEAAAMLMAPPPRTKEEFLVRFAQNWKVLRVGSFPQDEALD